MYDLVIENGIIVDGTGGTPYAGSLAFLGGKIAAVRPAGALWRGEPVFDAAGLFVAPGLIDAHTHADFRVLNEPVNELKLRQGVTCEIMGNCGFSLSPYGADGEAAWRGLIVNIIGRNAKTVWDFPRFPQYLDRVAAQPLGQHCGAMPGTGAVRAAVKGLGRGPMTAAERANARALVEEAMGAGALGLSSGLIYAPDCYSSTDDLLAMVKGLRKTGRPYTTHMRGEGVNLQKAVAEAIRLAAGAEVPLHISHFKAMGPDSWPLLNGAIELVECARARGQDVTCDCYPYTGGATTMTALLPPWAMEGGVAAAAKRLADPAVRREISAELNQPGDGWDNVLPGIGFGNVMIAGAAGASWRDAKGKSVQQLAEARGMPPEDVFFALLVDSACDVSCIHFSMKQEHVEQIMRLPWAFIASDSIYVPKDALHPRVCGTFPRVLHWGLAGTCGLHLEQMVQKTTSMPAARFGLAGHGLLKEGCAADVTLFSPDVCDRATYAEPTLPPQGIARTYIGGELVMEAGKYRARRPMGQLLRGTAAAGRASYGSTAVCLD